MSVQKERHLEMNNCVLDSSQSQAKKNRHVVRVSPIDQVLWISGLGRTVNNVNGSIIERNRSIINVRQALSRKRAEGQLLWLSQVKSPAFQCWT